MKKLFKMQLAVVLVLSMVLGMNFSVLAEEAVPTLFSTSTIQATVEAAEIMSFYETAEVTKDWEELIAKYAAGYEFDMSYFDNLEFDETTFTTESSAGFYGSRMMGLVAIGADPRAYFNRDLTAELVDKMDDAGSFGTVSDQVFAMLALNVFETEYNEALALEALVGMQNEDGGYGYAPGTSDLDTTGTVMIALGQYSDDIAIAAIEKAKAFIKPQQLASGGFPSWGSENSNTIARVITGLVAVGEDVYADAWLVDGKSMIDALMAYELEDHSYTWQLDPAETSGFSTKQVLMAYADLMNGRSSFDMLKDMNKSMNVGIRVEGAKANILDVVATVEYFGYGMSVKEVMELALTANQIPYMLESSQYGNYVSSIGGDTAGMFGGYDGWMYLLNGFSGWGIDSDQVKNGDELLFYYGDMAPMTMVPTVVADSLVLAPYEPFRILVSSTYDVYDENWNPTPTTVGVEGATVMINDTAYLTDAKGYVTINHADVTFDEKLTITVSKENEGASPSIVRTSALTTVITYDENRAFNDDDMISSWASEAVYEARNKELMLGSANVFSPKSTLTKAELSTLMVRIADKKVADYGTSFADVLSSSWYYEYISTGEEFKILSTQDKFFSPGGLVTRAEFAGMVAFAFGLEATEAADFADIDGLDADVVAAIAAVDEAGLLVGDGRNFKPDDKVTREMAAVVMMRLDAMEK